MTNVEKIEEIISRTNPNAAIGYCPISPKDFIFVLNLLKELASKS